jgi:hypothetical protein
MHMRNHRLCIVRESALISCAANRGETWVAEGMPRLRDEILDCVVYLYRSYHEADEGIEIGGSGFALGIPCENLPPPAAHIYAVTNKHVIENGAIHIRLNMREGKKVLMHAQTSDWVISPTDDLAIVPLVPTPAGVSTKPLPIDCLITKEMVTQYGIGIGDEVAMLGRFINREGYQKNVPTARFGHIAQMPDAPIETDTGIIQEEAFLCEVHSIGGYSGSPVLIIPNPTYTRAGESLPSDRGLLLGVDFCHLPDWQNAYDDRNQKLSHIKVPLNSGMAGVIPAWRLRDLLMSKIPCEQRKKAEELEVQRRRGAKGDL